MVTWYKFTFVENVILIVCLLYVKWFLKAIGMIKHWTGSVTFCDVRSFLFCRTEESRIAREQEKEEYSNFVLKACHMIKEHKTAIHVRDVKLTFLTERGIFVDNSFSTQTLTSPIVVGEVNHHV